MARKAARIPMDPGRQVFHILKFYFVFAPILAGLDKFFYELTNWSDYLSPFMMQIINNNDRPFMGVVGLIEIIVGIGVAIWPRVFGYILFFWLLLIIVNLLMLGQYFDIALRDLGLALAALCMAKLSMRYVGRHR